MIILFKKWLKYSPKTQNYGTKPKKNKLNSFLNATLSSVKYTHINMRMNYLTWRIMSKYPPLSQYTSQTINDQFVLFCYQAASRFKKNK